MTDDEKREEIPVTSEGEDLRDDDLDITGIEVHSSEESAIVSRSSASL